MLAAEEPSDFRSQNEHNLSWLRGTLKTVCMEPRYCGLCLETHGNFHSLSMKFDINEYHGSKSLGDVMSSLFNIDIYDYISSNSICELCTEKTIQSYVFIENTKKLFKVLNTCINDLYSKVTDLDEALEYDSNYESSNVMIVVEYDGETYNCIDEITRGNITTLSENTPLNNVKLMRDVQLKIPESVSNKSYLKERPSGPVIIPTPRVIKHSRKDILKKNHNTHNISQNTEKQLCPTITLDGGKLLIAPLATNKQSPILLNTYKCNSCPDIFTTYRTLKEHEKAKHNAKIYKCRFCGKTYNTQQYLDVHYKTDHNKTRCKICKDLFDNNKLNSHLSQMHRNQISECPHCDLAYYSLEQLETHLQSVHVVKAHKYINKPRCEMCLRYYGEKEITHHKCKFSCLECNVVPCVHYNYLMSYREQVLSHATRITCLDCDYVTKRKEHLIAHVNREHIDYHPYTCDYCKTQFYTKLSLKLHITKFHLDLKCRYCDTELKSSKQFKKHRAICKNVTRQNRCDECVASFDTEEELSEHKSQSHTEFVYPCTLCRKEFSEKTCLEEHHAKIHSGIQCKKRQKFIECTLCDITFRNKKDMLEHEQIHGKNDVFPCKVCPKTFTSLQKVYTHKQRHYSQKTSCSECGTLVSSYYLPQHKAVCPYLKGSKELPYICDVCGKSFYKASSLRIHQKLHVKMRCELCNKDIKSSLMERHMEAKHSSVIEKKIMKGHRTRVIFCNECGYIAKKNADYENHMNKMHLKIKPYICHICSKAFCGKARLAEHIKIHSNNGECFCSYCGQRFANKVCLKMHTRRHTGEKPYECNICHLKFRSSSIMKTHRLKTHQDKTVECPLCDSMFHLVAEMRYHVKRMHWGHTDKPFDYKELLSEDFHHLFEDRRLQKLGVSDTKILD